MKLIVKHGDVLDEAVDVLVCTANPTLSMSGGVNGALLSRGGAEVQAELRRYLAARGLRAVEPGTAGGAGPGPAPAAGPRTRAALVRTGPGPLAVKHLFHAVGVNAFYESSPDVIDSLLRTALTEAVT